MSYGSMESSSLFFLWSAFCPAGTGANCTFRKDKKNEIAVGGLWRLSIYGLSSLPSALGKFNISSVPTYDCPSVAVNMGCVFVTCLMPPFSGN